ncbi:MAG: peptide chain release factor N(5)-glutamine methyltransferase [Chloroflexi bacterium]|nr:peptide chain release factor N(5)-glutamine methyltransferase [Chloroflexota bacterium]
MILSVQQALARTRRLLASAGIEEASLEGELLLARSLATDRAGLYCSLLDPYPAGAGEVLEALLSRRLRREPLAYLLGEREFYGLRFLVGPGVFVPRPETELLVEQAILLAQGHCLRGGARIADVGTGSGAIAISIAVHLPGVRVFATDISPDALRSAEANAQAQGVAERVRLLQGDLLAPLPEPVDLVVANLPYVKSGALASLAPEVGQYEPLAALDGGLDGLDLMRRLLGQAPRYLRPGAAMLLELDPDQMDAASSASLSEFPGARLERLTDLAGLERCLAVRCGI